MSRKVIFDANNPGVWAFHCHILYHLASADSRPSTKKLTRPTKNRSRHPYRKLVCHGLRLFASKTDSFGEKSLKKEKHCHHWQHHETGSRHHQVELNSMHRFEKGQAQRQRI